MGNGTLLNFGKRYEDDLRIFDQWPESYLGLDALSNQNILKGIYYTHLVPLRSSRRIVKQTIFLDMQ